LNSAYGSCRVRSCAASVLDAGNTRMMFRGVGRSRPGVGQPGKPRRAWTRKTPEGHHLRRV